MLCHGSIRILDRTIFSSGMFGASMKHPKCYLDYWSNKEPVCHYCNHKNDYDYEGYDTDDYECSECGKVFEIEAMHTTEFTTRGKCEVHKLWRYGGEKEGNHSYTCQVCTGVYYDFHLPKMASGTYEILPADWRPE